MAKKSGSEKRKRAEILAARFSHEEAAVIRASAASRGYSIADLIRRGVFGTPLPPARHTPPPVELDLLARVLDSLGQLRTAVTRVGTNINQIAHAYNAGRDLDSMGNMIMLALAEHNDVIRDFRELRPVILQALGEEPRHHSDGDDPSNSE